MAGGAHTFRELKTGLEIRLVRHWTPFSVEGQFSIYFLALVMEVTLARLLKQRKPQARGCAPDITSEIPENGCPGNKPKILPSSCSKSDIEG